jgi:hypothetical protein
MPGWKQARAAFIIRDDALVVFVFFFVSHCHRQMSPITKLRICFTLLFPLSIHAKRRRDSPSVVLLL